MGQILKIFPEKSAKPEQVSSLNSNSDYYRAVVNVVSDGIAVLDEQGVISLFNPSAVTMTGWTAEDAQGLDFRSVFKFFNTDEHSITEEQNPVVIAIKTGFPVERDDLLLETHSKKRVHVSVKVAPTKNPAKKNLNNVNIMIVFRNITLEQQEQREQSEFISTASHEMRTPVAIIEGYLGMLMNPATATLDARGMEYAKKAHEAAQQLGRLFQDLLDVTKVDDHRVRTELSLIDSAEAAKQIVDQFQTKAAEKGLQLIYDEPTAGHHAGKTLQPVHIIYVDLIQLNEILGNIVDNAIKYTKQGSVSVSVSSSGERVRFSVRDTGIGIPAEDVPHLFQKFYRVDNSDTREIGGTGLGLYLIKKLAENLGGKVGVDSDYGKGSTFWVEFPELTRDQAVRKAQEIQRQDAAYSL